MCLSLLIFSPLEQFEISSFNTPLKYISTFPIELFENNYLMNIYSYINSYILLDLLIIFSLIYIMQTILKQKGYIFLFLVLYSLNSQLNIYNFNDIIINKIGMESFSKEWLIANPSQLHEFKEIYFSMIHIAKEHDIKMDNIRNIQFAYSIAKPEIDFNHFSMIFEYIMYSLEISNLIQGPSICVSCLDLWKVVPLNFMEYMLIWASMDDNPPRLVTTNEQAETIFNWWTAYSEFGNRGQKITNLRNILSFQWNENFFKQGSAEFQIIFNTYEYITTLSSYINIYSVLFCFIFTYMIIYLIYNRVLSNNTNTLIPNIYQLLGENLYKISLNLFYSILGKDISIPEFFIKINTIFIFLILSNIQGMIPYLSTLTSALTNTFFIALALFISIIKTILDKKGFNYFLNLFMPSGCPILLSLLIIPIELISYSFRLVSLSVRLFANMMAGHTLLKVIVGFSWIIVFSGSMSFINIFPIIILFILTLLEFGVALIQAYIFTVLSCIYLRDIFEGH